jgi:hypothetical protein
MPVSAIAAKLEFAQAPQPFPLISLATAKDPQLTFFLPLRIVLGAPPGSGGFTLVGDGSRFDWHAAAPGAAAAAKKKAAPPVKRAAPATKKAAPPVKRAAPAAKPLKKKATAAAAAPKKKAAVKALKKQGTCCPGH